MNRQIEVTPEELTAAGKHFSGKMFSYVFLLSNGPLASFAMKVAAKCKQVENENRRAKRRMEKGK